MSLAHAGHVSSRTLAAVVQSGWLFPLCVLLALLGVYAAWLVRRLVEQRRQTLVFSERARMAREIPDTLLQGLVGVELQLDAIQERPDVAVDAVKRQLVKLRGQVADAIHETRLSIWNLRLPDLAADGLPGSLRRAGDALTLGSQVRFDLAVSGAPRVVDPYVNEQLLRIAQEAVSNAVRHASATAVCVSLCYADDSVRLRVSDDGCGFDASRLRGDGAHWGLKGMEERALQIGSRLVVVSKPGEGTVLEATAPFSTAA